MAGPRDGPGVAPRASAGRKPERAGRGPRGGRGASWDPKFASLSVTSRDRSARCPRATREAPVPRPARAPVARGARTCSRSLRGEWPRPDEAAQARAAPAAAGRPCGRPRAGGRCAQRGERAGRARGGGARPGSPRPPTRAGSRVEAEVRLPHSACGASPPPRLGVVAGGVGRRCGDTQSSPVHGRRSCILESGRQTFTVQMDSSLR